MDLQAIRYACRRIEDFATVHAGRSLDERRDAVCLLLEALGVDEEGHAALDEWFSDFIHPDYEAVVWIGVLVGLFMHDFEQD